jgi:hypothetical protein
LPPSLSPSFLPVAARRDGGKDDRGGREGGREGGKEGGKEGGREGGEEGGQSRQQLLSGREAEVCEAEEGGREGGREGVETVASNLDRASLARPVTSNMIPHPSPFPIFLFLSHTFLLISTYALGAV